MAATSWSRKSGSRRCNQRTAEWPLPATVVVVVALTIGPWVRARVSDVLPPLADTTATNTSETATASAAILAWVLPLALSREWFMARPSDDEGVAQSCFRLMLRLCCLYRAADGRKSLIVLVQ